ncbi:hypothetical protein A2554_01155 [Candidatus Nomurabacteria bacterium RIFOXYD2_FULL_35_12]|nr:MAG: hypothetical protein A2554_01155 [Candidatus Nomurabacteria bacterium RIFOXYD2_FULL_35_12]
MKINIAITISVLTLILGFVTKQVYLWIPLTVLIAGLIDMFSRQWVASDRLGSSINLSMFLKSLCSLAVLYVLIGQIICLGLVVWWFI